MSCSDPMRLGSIPVTIGTIGALVGQVIPRMWNAGSDWTGSVWRGVFG